MSSSVDLKEHLDKKQKALEKLNTAKFGRSHIQAILVAGSGFFVDSYDNFVIGLIVPMLAYGYFSQSALDTQSDGWLKAASSYGNLFGQFFFAILGDILGRKRMYGIELIILIGGAIGCAVCSWPTGSLSIVGSLAIWRFILGVGVGGDYPVSAVITSEFASSKRRGQMIAIVFAMQGFGILVGAIVSVIVLVAFKPLIEQDYHNLNYCWRIIAGFGAIPALLAVYFRLTIPETPRYAMDVLNDVDRGVQATNVFLAGDKNTEQVGKVDNSKEDTKKAFESYKVAFRGHFSQWANIKILIGCCATWFFLDIGYYGTSLNTATALGFIGYGAPTGNYTNPNAKVYDDLWNRAVGTVLINLAGTVPGYWFSVALIEKWGRKPIQYMGFVLLTLIFLFMAIFFHELTAKGSSLVILFMFLYAFAQFFFNFGPNVTTFVIPAEAFPTIVRSTGHGISAASGKLGAIIAAQGFSAIAKSSIGIQGVLYIFAACCFVGTLFTILVPETKGKSLEDLTEETKTNMVELTNTNSNSTPTSSTSNALSEAELNNINSNNNNIEEDSEKTSDNEDNESDQKKSSNEGTQSGNKIIEKESEQESTRNESNKENETDSEKTSDHDDDENESNNNENESENNDNNENENEHSD